MIEVPYSALESHARPPAYARPGDAGADLVAIEDVALSPSGGRALVRTGLSLAIPDGMAGLVLPRSGLAINHGVTCLNAPGLIDAGYRGEIQVVLVNTDPESRYEVHKGDRIAQLVLVTIETASFIAANALPSTDRGTGGFGHSGR